ncbi:MAG: PHP domain-containing protein [Thermomicrobiales bacterium]|nr:PHP domain-containing protein [Thermomicrobiales bacterium]
MPRHAANPIDLHVHSWFSDGSQSPEGLVAAAVEVGVQVLGLTDHDTVAGVVAAVDAAARHGVRLIPGVEISTSLPLRLEPPERLPVHLLGYGYDPTDEELLDTLAFSARARDRRIRRIVARLRELGVPVDAERVFALAGTGSVGRPHVALALVEIGAAANVRDAFARFLGSGKPAYVRRPPVDTEATIELIRRAGGAPVLAHPDEFRDRDETGQPRAEPRYDDLERLLDRLVPAGLLGMEVDYGDYDATVRAALRAIAERRGLAATGGSDYHGLTVKPDRPLGMAPVPPAAVEELDAAIALAQRQRP